MTLVAFCALIALMGGQPHCVGQDAPPTPPVLASLQEQVATALAAAVPAWPAPARDGLTQHFIGRLASGLSKPELTPEQMAELADALVRELPCMPTRPTVSYCVGAGEVAGFSAAAQLNVNGRLGITSEDAEAFAAEVGKILTDAYGRLRTSLCEDAALSEQIRTALDQEIENRLVANAERLKATLGRPLSRVGRAADWRDRMADVKAFVEARVSRTVAGHLARPEHVRNSAFGVGMATQAVADAAFTALERYTAVPLPDDVALLLRKGTAEQDDRDLCAPEVYRAYATQLLLLCVGDTAACVHERPALIP